LILTELIPLKASTSSIITGLIINTPISLFLFKILIN
jgi:hypothetical protein